MIQPDDQARLEAAFPLACTLKLIAIELEGVEEMIREAVARLPARGPLRTGNHSSGGKYVTFQVDMEFQALAEMQAAIQALGAVEGVKLVL